MLDLSGIDSAVRSEGGVSRRLMMAYSAALAGLPLLANKATAVTRRPRLVADPFTLGVASGDPDSTSVVLWTKLAPKPEQPDGGMGADNVLVMWEIAEDDAMKTIVAKGETITATALGHSVHVEAKGLKPDRWYWYRFKVGDASSPIGRTRTFPTAESAAEKLKFAFASCQHYEQGYYTAYQQMAKDELDLVIHLGDYIYEYPAGRDEKLIRKHSGRKDGKIKTLDDYRLRHAQYRSDPFLNGMHALCPWLVTWDDHEFDNNYANDIQEDQRQGKLRTDPVSFLYQRADAYRAYYEFMPLRPTSLPKGPDMTLYRKASFGSLADFFVLDTRQYRTDQPNGDGVKPLNDKALDPRNTLLGKTQRGWLDAGLLASKSTWNVLAQQVMMAMVEINYAMRTGYSMDQWPGAAHERMDLIKMIGERQVANPVVITGDIHSNWVNDLRVDDRKPETPVIATEFVGTSITSGGKGMKDFPGLDAMKAKNPGVIYHNRERGYVRCTVTPKLWTSDYVVAEDVTRKDGPVVTRQSFVVQAGKPGAKPV